eukprot:CAMPEP_0182609570 /NCGR_PEP_ID=MMETSP1330-20130603/3618_1 /TAXON_ID=464278 /ORGANISM="Picochlorum sp., Strain RCC944" /LENGTH=107 /DNA_ID=CAMNT_0024828437 /DNA_START=152 /DNA_END=471 /DNA_ORIENTATION=+
MKPSTRILTLFLLVALLVTTSASAHSNRKLMLTLSSRGGVSCVNGVCTANGNAKTDNTEASTNAPPNDVDADTNGNEVSFSKSKTSSGRGFSFNFARSGSGGGGWWG